MQARGQVTGAQTNTKINFWFLDSLHSRNYAGRHRSVQKGNFPGKQGAVVKVASFCFSREANHRANKGLLLSDADKAQALALLASTSSRCNCSLFTRSMRHKSYFQGTADVSIAAAAGNPLRRIDHPSGDRQGDHKALLWDTFHSKLTTWKTSNAP